MQYRVLSVIKYERTRYEAGAIIELRIEEAEDLIKTGAVEPVDRPFAKQIKNPFGDKP